MTDNSNANRRVLLEARDIVKVFGSGAYEVRPLKGIDLKLYAGELTLLMGPSGSGKTTLLSILGCILSPTEGQLDVAGNQTVGLDAEGLANVRRQHVGFVFQGYNLFPTMTATENVMLALDVRAKPVVDPPTHALNALIAVGLGHRAQTYPAKLSGGEKQRVALARALAGAPSLILADEPTAALDAENGRAVMALLSEVAKDPTRAVLAVTHDHRTLPYADRIVRIEDGKIHSDERPKKGAIPTSGADPHHDAHASHAAPVSQPSQGKPDDDNPTIPPSSIGGRYRIRRHA
jgi:putative ABC transport system ATP-binding protein